MVGFDLLFCMVGSFWGMVVVETKRAASPNITAYFCFFERRCPPRLYNNRKGSIAKREGKNSSLYL